MAEGGDSKKCTNCRQMISVRAFAMHEVHCVKYCTYCEDCEDTVPNDEYHSHMDECHAPQPCVHCTQRILPKHMEQHKELCPEGMVQCKYCELDTKRKDYSEHVDACSSRTEPCTMCSMRVRLRDMQEHLDMKCGHLRSEPTLDPHTLAHLHTSTGLDEQWVERVAGVYGDVDSLLAQNINYFENAAPPLGRAHRRVNEQPPSAVPPHRLVNELPPSAVIPDTAGDVDLALRLQEEEMRRDRAFKVDQNLARQIQNEESQTQTLTAPPTDQAFARRLQDAPPTDQELDRRLQDAPPTDQAFARRLQDEEVRRDRVFGRDLELARQLQQEESSQPHTSQPHTLTPPSLTPHSSQPHSSQPHTSQPHSSQPHSSQPHSVEDESFARSLQMSEDKHQYMSTYDDEEMLPCQFCNALCPVAQLIRHQNSCRHGNQDIERDTAVANVDVNVDVTMATCVYCSKLFPEEQCAVHEALCEENPDVKLNTVYPVSNGQPSHSGELMPLHSGELMPSHDDEIPCETCNKLFPFTVLHRHQVTCSLQLSPRGVGSLTTESSKPKQVPQRRQQRTLAIRFPLEGSDRGLSVQGHSIAPK